ncbi:nuclear transport factor 2 family protein [Cellulomonas endophytica]|uniref:nuclear transport factor 2 family protein n=1 Tax=Cellulomonas endophytica TaxID=2494735 RepID=UPI0010118372|nr:nuclear transport factor 2 family protein [Cellulomonas endophytica]
MSATTRTPSASPIPLPAILEDFLAAHGARDTAAALRAFTPTAVVVDDGTTYAGTDGIRRFLTKGDGGYSWTAERLAAERVDDDRWVVTHRLTGDFPGGVVDLRYRFTLQGGLVGELVIAP